MNRVSILPMLASLLVVQAGPQPVVSTGQTAEPNVATFAGGYLITAARSDVAMVDLSSGLTVSHLPQGSLVQAVEASPAGDLVAVGTCGHDIKLWNVTLRAMVRRIALPQECAESLSFSPDGALLATGAYGCCAGGDGLQVWDVRTGTLSRKFAEGSAIRHVVFSGDGRWLAGVDAKGKATVFEWPSGRELRTIQGLALPGLSRSRAIASRDGRYLGWLGDRLRLWDMTSAGELPLRPEASAAEFLDDGRLVYVDGDEMFAMRPPDGPPQMVSRVNPERDLTGALVTGYSWLKIRRDGFLAGGFNRNASRTVVWDIAESRLRHLVAPAVVSAGSLCWSRSGIVAWADVRSGVQGWDDRSGRLVDLGREIVGATRLAMRPDGARLAVTALSSVYVVDVTGGRVLAARELPSGLETGIGFSPDGSRLAFSSSEGFAVFDGSLRPRRRIETLDAHTEVEHVAFSPDGHWIAAGLSGPQTLLRVWPAGDSGRHITLDTSSVAHGSQPPAFSADSQRLASFYRDRSVMIWATDAWNVARILTLPGTGRALAFAPEGSRLAVASDSEAAIWDADAGRKLVTLTTPGSAEMTEIAWSPDGRRVVTSADDGVLRFWRSTDGGLLASLYVLHSGDWLLVTPDGRVDGSEQALATMVAWRAGERVTSDHTLTQSHRVPGLWQSLLTVPRQ